MFEAQRDDMKIQHINFTPLLNINKGQNPQNNSVHRLNFTGDKFAKSTEPDLKTYIDKMSAKMSVGKNVEFFLDALKTIDTNDRRAQKPLSIADIGCCDGALCRTLKDFLPVSTNYYGIDLSDGMLEAGRTADKALLEFKTNYIQGNAYDVDKIFSKNHVDAIILSSIMHELYSYADEEHNEPAYSKDSIKHFMQSAFEALKPGGILIIKDPATPHSDPYEPIKICNASKTDGKIPPVENEEELASADITKLCTLDKLKRFCMDFFPAQDQNEWDGDTCIVPRWLVTEFVRHRKWLATPENWAYEIKENYGTLRPDEISEFAVEIGFDTIKADNISIPNEVNIYKILDGEFELRDIEDNILDLESFPMFLEVVLRKPREHCDKFNQRWEEVRKRLSC